RLVARDAPAEIDSTFIRRYQVQSTIGLPLLAGERFLGLVYLNYRSKERAPDDNKLRELERRAGTAAALIQSALEGAERTALEGLSRLTSLLTTPVGDARTDAKELRRLLSIALADLLMASNLDGAAIYQFGHQRSHLELENSNRLLSALGDMTAAMLKPGASRHEVIDAVVGHLTDSEVPEFDFNFATVYLLDQREDDATVVRMAAGAATAASIEGTAPHAGKKVPRWALEEDRLLAESDVLVYVARTWQTVIVGPLPAGDHGDVISGGVPVQST